MKAGDYVRTKRGQIHKITDLKTYYEKGELIEDKQLVHIDNHFSGWDLGQFKELISKSSPNIIDLIEVGDYVNGIYIEGNNGKYLETLDVDGENSWLGHIEYLRIYSNEIKTIVTKEQFESMEYKLGVDKE